MLSPVPRLSMLERLTAENLDHIAYYTSALTFKGPPADILSLCLVSKTISDALKFQNNKSLYARLFRFKFDYSAVKRRFSERWTTSGCLAIELKKRFYALQRIRRKEAYRIDDLWTVYIMMTEGDGKNELQLFEWAGLALYIRATLLAHIMGTHERPSSRLLDVEATSLLVWLLWMGTTRGEVEMEDSRGLDLLLNMLQPFIAAGYRFPSMFAPDSYFYLPLCPQMEVGMHCAGPSPRHTTIKHYGHHLTLAVPPLTPAVALAMTVRLETHQSRTGLPDAIYDLPRNRQEAFATGRRGMTVEDVRAFHYDVRIHVPERCPLNLVESNCEGSEEGSNVSILQGSRRWDEDWSRLVACHDPWGHSPLRGKVYTPRALAGSWAGRIMLPRVDAHLALINNPTRSASTVPVYYQGLYMTLHEHHCLAPDEPLGAGEDETGGDDVLSAWLPHSLSMRQLEDAIEVVDRQVERSVRYETVISRGEAPYSRQASTKLQKSWISEDDPFDCEGRPRTEASTELSEAISEGTALATCVSIDNDDLYEDTVSHQSSGVADILVTGETGELHGDAWGHYTIVGRVRPWDGLVVLLRAPADPAQSLGTWIFRGYIHDQNLVGRWRDTANSIGMIGYEGSFVMTRVGAL